MNVTGYRELQKQVDFDQNATPDNVLTCFFDVDIIEFLVNQTTHLHNISDIPTPPPKST